MDRLLDRSKARYESSAQHHFAAAAAASNLLLTVVPNCYSRTSRRLPVCLVAASAGPAARTTVTPSTTRDRHTDETNVALYADASTLRTAGNLRGRSSSGVGISRVLKEGWLAVRCYLSKIHCTNSDRCRSFLNISVFYILYPFLYF